MNRYKPVKDDTSESGSDADPSQAQHNKNNAEIGSMIQRELNKMQINECKCKHGSVKFTWKPVNGAEKYRLIIKDKLLSERVANDEIVPGGKCEIKVQLSEKLCIGRTCVTKVIAYTNGMTFESDWKHHLIGGDRVPRNVKASHNPDNPKRSILVTFDAPKHGPVDQYKIVAVPNSGKKKTFFCSTKTTLIEYLRKGIGYKCVVHAKYGEKWSEGSPSNYQETDGGDENLPPVSYSRITGTVNAQRATIHGTTTNLSIPQGDDFGKVRDLVLALAPHERKEKDLLTLSWKVPTFGNKAIDYKVENYKVKVRKKDSNKCIEFSLEFEKGLDAYSVTKLELDLGEMYEIFVSTTYIDIDQDEEYTSNAERTKLLTRPCKPKGIKSKVIKIGKSEEKLKIEWNATKGADQHEVEIYTDDSEPEPVYRKNVGSKTKWSQTFVEGFGYGTSYYAVVTAIRENKLNSIKSARKTIGGDLSPRNVHALRIHKEVADPKTQVYLRWEAPVKKPVLYEISYEVAGKTVKVTCKKNMCLIEHLKAGNYYIFNVVAIFKKTKSGRCLSNRIQTNPTPTQVKNVHTSPGDNPSTSGKIFWDKVDAEKKDETTVYRVTVASVDKVTSREFQNVTDDYLYVFGLEPDTKYFTTVAGGNSDGFGKNSEKCLFKTGCGMPKDVELLNHVDEDLQSTSLVLMFANAEGGPLKHVCSLYKCQNEHLYKSNVEVNSGHAFTDLEPNTEYFAQVHAVFENEKHGENVRSETVLTGPSKPEIYESHCCKNNGINSSRELVLKWKSDKGCTEHEIQIKHDDEIESQQIVNNKNELRYSCEHEASQYTARVRIKNKLFGPWSDEVNIVLAPKKILSVSAELEIDGSNIIIQCDKAVSGCFSYICQAFFGDQIEGQPMLVQPKEAEDIVKFTFEPTQHARKYHFELWAENHNGLRGESSFSENVTSRPGHGNIEKAERTQENPSMDISIAWKALDKCDGYEVKIERTGEQKPESVVRTTETTCTYRCQFPGSEYGVRIRGISTNVCGYWSEKKLVQLQWRVPERLSIKYDTNDPSRRAKISWDKPDGVNCFRLEIENNQLGTVIPLMLRKDNYVFESGIPGNSYTVRLYCGYDGCYSPDCKQTKMTMKPNPPRSIKAVANRNVNGIIVTYKESFVQLATYEVCLKRLTQEGENEETKTEITTAERAVLKNLVPGGSYEVSVSALCNNERSKTIILDEYVMTFPDEVTNLRSLREQNGSIIFQWDPLFITPDNYVVQWRANNEAITEELTRSTKFEIFNSKPEHAYSLRVMASNSAGNGKMTSWETLRAEPYPPTHIKAVAHRRMNGIIVSYIRSSVQSYSYEVCAELLNEEGKNEEQKLIATTEEFVMLKNLVSGGTYRVSVTTLCSGERSKTSLDEYVQTFPGEVTNLRSSEEENGIIVFEWDPLDITPDNYVVQWRINKEGINEELTECTKFEIPSPRLASTYILRVMASNSAGNGKMTSWLTFITDPLPPRNLKVMLDQFNPQTSFSVTYEDDIDPLKEYKVTAVTAVGKEEEAASVTTKSLMTRITGLASGTSYYFKVQTIFCGKKSEELYYRN